MEHYNEELERLLQDIDALESGLDEKQAKELSLEQTTKIAKRLAQFAPDCDSCKEFLPSLQQSIIALKAAANKDNKKSYHMLVQTILNHLQQEHNLVAEGHYTSMYMAFGVSIGLVLGLFFAQLIDNFAFMGMGLPIGIVGGLILGMGSDEKAKKEGQVI